MSGTEQLRKENQSLRNEIADLKEKMQKISENLSTMEEQHGRRRKEREMSPGRVHAIEFVSQQYDVLTKFKEEAARQIKELVARVDEISTLCDRITKSIEASEAYSYRFNLKVCRRTRVTSTNSQHLFEAICGFGSWKRLFK